MLDRPLLEVAPEFRAGGIWDRLVEVVTTRRAQQFELPDRRRRITTYYNMNVVPLGDGFMVSMSDITRLKDAYRELETKHADLARVNDMLERHGESLGKEVSRRESLEAELRRLADVDELTGVASRRVFVAAATQAIATASAARPVAVIGLDIDHFKAINDLYGHLAGDRVLSAVGAELERQCRECDVVGRLGGEEFAMLVTDTNLELAALIAERLRRRFLDLVVAFGDARITVTASFGVAAWSAGDTYDHLLARADDGLYRAKRAGRDQVVVVDKRHAGPRPRVGRNYAA